MGRGSIMHVASHDLFRTKLRTGIDTGANQNIQDSSTMVPLLAIQEAGKVAPFRKRKSPQVSIHGLQKIFSVQNRSSFILSSSNTRFSSLISFVLRLSK